MHVPVTSTSPDASFIQHRDTPPGCLPASFSVTDCLLPLGNVPYLFVDSNKYRHKRTVTFRQNDLSAGTSKEAKEAKEPEENKEAKSEITEGTLP